METDNRDTGVSSISNSLSIDKEQGIDIEHPPYSVYSNYSVSGDCMNFSDNLTATDPDDFWFFSVDTDRSIVF